MSIQWSEAVEPASVNPLDLVEEIVLANDWVFERADSDELAVEVAGTWCNYRLLFIWQDDFSSLQFFCQYCIAVPEATRPKLYPLLAKVNERLWLGHFMFPGDEVAPVFRHTLLMRGTSGASLEQIEDLVDFGLSEAERFYPAFQYVIMGGGDADQALRAAIVDILGEA
ncbi:MAG: YbjN domain-containing protein [Pseudomonadota bacterium]